MVDPVDIDHVGMPPRLVADDARSPASPRHVDGEGEAVADRVARHGDRRRHPCGASTSGVSACSRRSAVSLNNGEPRRMRNCTSREPVRTRMLNARGLNLGIERALVALADAVELGALIGDDAGEHVEPADRAFRVGHRRACASAAPGVRAAARCRRNPFPAPRPRQVDPVHREHRRACRARCRPRAGQKAGAHPVGDLAEPQIDARRLDLVVADRLGGQDLAPPAPPPAASATATARSTAPRPRPRTAPPLQPRSRRRQLRRAAARRS